MKIFPAEAIRQIDAYTIGHEPVSSAGLMERAAKACTQEIIKTIDYRSPVIIIVGPGNNGGDGLVIARQLSNRYYTVQIIIPEISQQYTPDFLLNLALLEATNRVRILRISTLAELPEIPPQAVIIDALFGTGLNRSPQGLSAEVIQWINQSGCTAFSIDIPSGLHSEGKMAASEETTVKASITLSFQFPKLVFFFPEFNKFTGKWILLDIGLHPQIIQELPSSAHYFTQMEANEILKPRPVFSHKGTYGHALIIAGSRGMMGASVLAAKACLRSGSGLVTAHIPASQTHILHASVPEVLVSADSALDDFTSLPEMSRFSAIGIGPGLGKKPESIWAFERLLKEYRKPLVVDADALNMVAAHPGLMDLIPEESILTPHPGEFARLFSPESDSYKRMEKQIALSIKHKIYIVLKGAFTSISCPDGELWFNSTGNPGMATGGSGDVLTGIILGLLAQGYTPGNSAKLGVWLHGRAGDFAAEKRGTDSLIAGDIIHFLGDAFLSIQNSLK